MHLARFFLLISFLISPLISFSGEKCVPSFPYKDGWMGGDRAYSILLPGNRVLWLFGDSFVKSHGLKSRKDAVMVANSIAISRCEGNKWSIRYYWKMQDAEKHQAFFPSGTKEFRYWPLDGFTCGGNLYVCLVQVRNTKEGGAFGFEEISVSLAKISNPEDDPFSWPVQYRDLIKGFIAFPGISAVVQGNFVYLFTVLDDAAHKHHPILLTRLPLKHLDRPAEHLQYLSMDHKWKKGLDWKDALVLMDRGSTEMTVRFHPAIKRWVAVFGNPEFPAKNIVIRTSKKLEGSWSEQKVVYKIPEMDPQNESYHKDHFFYAAKEHIEFLPAGSDGLLITYVGNSFDFMELVENLNIY